MSSGAGFTCGLDALETTAGADCDGTLGSAVAGVASRGATTCAGGSDAVSQPGLVVSRPATPAGVRDTGTAGTVAEAGSVAAGSAA
jgi:hypothetical protein